MSQPLRDWTGYDCVGAIMAYEGGESSDEDTLRLFQHLVDTKLAWSLQGSYGRMATDLIKRGLVSDDPAREPRTTLEEVMQET